MKPPIVMVHWLDAMGSRNDALDDDGKEKLRAIHCLSIGVLIERSLGKRGHIKIASELIEGGEYQEIQVIPNGMVLKVTRVANVDTPKELGHWVLKKFKK